MLLYGEVFNFEDWLKKKTSKKYYSLTQVKSRERKFVPLLVGGMPH
jgi:hypothetical protein